MSKRVEPPTNEEHDDMVRRHEREIEIPSRLRDIETWVAKIKALKGDIRNTPDIRTARDGGTFVSGATDLDVLLQGCAAVRQRFESGEIDLARSVLRGVESTIQAINNRVVAPLIKAHDESVKGGAKGAAKKRRSFEARNRTMAEEFLKLHPHPRQKETEIKIRVGKARGLGRSASIDAVNRGLQILSGDRGKPD